MPNFMPREALISQRTTGVTVFRAGFVTLAVWAGATLYLFATVDRGAAVMGALVFAALPVLTFIAGLGIYAVAVNNLRAQYGESSSGLLRRQRRVVSAQPQQGDDVDSILRRMEQDFR